MKNVGLTFGILFFLIMVSMALSKPRIDLNDYEEECYQYKQIPYVANYTFPDFKDGKYCWMDRSGFWNLNCSIVNIVYFYNGTRNGECIKYHLVRKV